ncbi:MAG: hypothetical protein ACYCYF_11505, partial [Anaerolineae bacterium]
MRSMRRLLYMAMTVLLVLAVTAPSLAQTASPRGTVTPTAEPQEDEQEATVTPETESEAVAAAAGNLELTIYNQSLGLVREVRSADLNEGLNEISVTDIPAQIIPASVHMTPLTGSDGTTLLEQRFDYDVVTSASLLRRYIDQTISLTTQDGQS